MSSPRRACTGTPRSTSAAATSSCVVSGLAEQSATSAPPAVSACIRLAVSAVTWRHAATFTPSSGWPTRKRSRIERRTGIWPSAHSIRRSPCGASDGSWTSGLTLIAVVLALVRALDRHADVGGLLGRELGEPRAERVQVQAGHLLVQVLRQHVDLLLVLVVLREQLDLGDRLVRERVGHHEARVAGGVAEVQQAALREDNDRVAVGEAPLVDLRLDVDPLDALGGGEARDVDLVVEVADVAHDRLVLHLRHVLGGDDVLVAGGGDEDVRRPDDVVERDDLVALHRRLQRADRVDFGDQDARALAPQRLRAALADVAVAADDRNLAA